MREARERGRIGVDGEPAPEAQEAGAAPEARAAPELELELELELEVELAPEAGLGFARVERVLGVDKLGVAGDAEADAAAVAAAAVGFLRPLITNNVNRRFTINGQ